MAFKSEALPDEFGQAEMPGQVLAGRSSPALASRRRSSKAIRMRSGWSRGSI